VCRMVTEHTALIVGEKQIDDFTQNTRSGEGWQEEKLVAAET